jgi:3-oxoacyl-[acyl-carrier protein] reductase
MFRLDGRTALVTGASQGIGEAVARQLAAQGARLVLAARGIARLEALAHDLSASGAAAAAFALDLSRPEEIPERLKALPDGFGDIDVLVNNAGITADNLVLRMSLEQWNAVLTTNLTGSFLVTKELLRGMMKRRWGRVVTISSVVGVMGNAGQANYAAAKAGLIGFTKSVAKELASRGITANVVAPGFIATAMTAALPEEARKRMFEGIPAGRLGSPDDVAAAVCYLASEEASYVTGQVLHVNGGMYV